MSGLFGFITTDIIVKAVKDIFSVIKEYRDYKKGDKSKSGQKKTTATPAPIAPSITVVNNIDTGNKNIVSNEKKKKTAAEKLGERMYSVFKSFNQYKENLVSHADLVGLINRGILELKVNESEKKEMTLSSIEDLEDIFSGKKKVNLKFIDAFCRKTGANKEWVKNDRTENMFSVDTSFTTPSTFSDFFDDQHVGMPAVEKIYMVRQNNNEGETFVIAKTSNWNYLVFSNSWGITDKAGDSGSYTLFSFYNLLKEIEIAGNISRVDGIILGPKDFYALKEGRVSPKGFIEGKRAKGQLKGKYWCNDFIDIDCDQARSIIYKKKYGESFVEAQQLTKDKEKIMEKKSTIFSTSSLECK